MYELLNDTIFVMLSICEFYKVLFSFLLYVLYFPPKNMATVLIVQGKRALIFTLVKIELMPSPVSRETFLSRPIIPKIDSVINFWIFYILYVYLYYISHVCPSWKNWAVKIRPFLFFCTITYYPDQKVSGIYSENQKYKFIHQNRY